MSCVGPIRRPSAKSRTGILGVGYADVTVRGRKQPHVFATAGRRTKKWNLKRHGRAEALRKAIAFRAQYEAAWREAA